MENIVKNFMCIIKLKNFSDCKLILEKSPFSQLFLSLFLDRLRRFISWCFERFFENEAGEKVLKMESKSFDSKEVKNC